MPNFSKRSSELELLDKTSPPPDVVKRNYNEMASVNRLLGGYSPLIKHIEDWMKQFPNKKSWVILDIGCGIGDVLHHLDNHFNTESIHYIGVDTNKMAIDMARTNPVRQERFTWINKPYQSLNQKADVVISSLFTHHLTNEEMNAFIQWSDNKSGIGWVISDLHRHPLGYYGIKLLSRILPTTYLFEQDAPLSVLRAFTRADYKPHTEAGAILQWHWAFRWTLSKSTWV